jgi:hypothetical protein
MSTIAPRRRRPAALLFAFLVGPLAACATAGTSAGGSSTPTRAASSTGELTAEQACLYAHPLGVASVRRVGATVEVTFSDGAKSREPVEYRVHRRPTDRSAGWTVVGTVRRAPAPAIVWTDGAAPTAALSYGVTADIDCGGTVPSVCDGGPCFFVNVPAIAVDASG